MLQLNAKTTALVIIDLQEGILPFAGGPHSANDVVARAAGIMYLKPTENTEIQAEFKRLVEEE